MKHRRAVTIVGLGDDGCKGLTARAMDAIARADVLVGGGRHLDFFREFPGERVPLRSPIASALERIAALAEEHQVCVLASGDPLFFGIGSLVIRRVGAEHVEVIPQPSSVQRAFARVGLTWDDAAVLSLHGRPREGFATRLKQTSKVAVLTDDENSPARLAAHLVEHGETAWRAWVCENLGGPDERVRCCSVVELQSFEGVAPLNVLILERADPCWKEPPTIPFLPEEAFAKRTPKKGLITKREVRLLSLAALAIRPDSVVWDIGAGSGSVSIEAAMLSRHGRVYAVEVDPEGVQLCRENVRTHGVDNVRIVPGRAPEILGELEAPDAVFIGGSKGGLAEIIDVALARLKPHGRVVVNTITLENAGEASRAFHRHGIVPEVMLVQVSRAQPLLGHLRYEALNPIQIFAADSPSVREVTT